VQSGAKSTLRVCVAGGTVAMRLPLASSVSSVAPALKARPVASMRPVAVSVIV
jgi:hypothetical protein